MGWQWHQLDNRQIIFTSLETDNDASTSPLSFYRPDVLPVAQPTASQYWRHKKLINITTEKLNLTHKQLLGLFICVWKYEYFMLLITAGTNADVILAKSFQAHISFFSQHKAPSVQLISIVPRLCYILQYNNNHFNHFTAITQNNLC